MVKHRFKKWEEDCIGKQEPRKVIKPTESEIEQNYKSRSAKLRIFKKFAEKGGAHNVLQRIPTD